MLGSKMPWKPLQKLVSCTLGSKQVESRLTETGHGQKSKCAQRCKNDATLFWVPCLLTVSSKHHKSCGIDEYVVLIKAAQPARTCHTLHITSKHLLHRAIYKIKQVYQFTDLGRMS